MTRYALLILPSANRVYADTAVSLTEAELAVFSRGVLDGRLADIATESIGGVPYVTFSVDGLTDRDVALLSNLSALYALFQVEGDLLRPVPGTPLDRYDDDLITIPKYVGKTNEQFTKLLLNVTLMASAFAGELGQRRFSVIDPLCGRGTTLNQALMYGFDAAGIELDRVDVEAYKTFVETWLKRKRIKHKAEYVPVRRNRQVVARRLQVSLAADREEYKAGAAQRLDVVYADTVNAGDFFRPETFDLVVTDAPYGVQHGSRSGAKGLRRDPLDLLREAVPGWARLLRSGGAVGIAWNTHVAGRPDLAEVLAKAGLTVIDAPPYLALGHRVDQSIVRDVIVATKP